MLIGLCLFVISVCLIIPVLAIAIEVSFALGYFVSHKHTDQNSMQPELDSYKIIMPAHNEQDIISNTLAALSNHTIDPHSIIVIADNCTDHTAEVARKHGVVVIERNDLSRLGKGYALDFGLNYLKKNPPDVVVILDADCSISNGSLGQLAYLSLQENRPVQGRYIMTVEANDGIKKRIAALAFMFKNYIRPLGLKQLGFPCLLTGTGIAFPWELAMETQFATGNIVEDMQIGIDLINEDKGALFFEQLTVVSQFPNESKTVKNQRTRWEHGHLSTIATQVPRLMASSFRRKKLGLLFTALDLAVPPLSFLTIILLINFAASVTGVVFFDLNELTLVLSSLPLAIFIVTIFVGWNRFAKEIITLQQMLMIPFYVVSKIPVYFKFCLGPEKRWIKTDRE